MRFKIFAFPVSFSVARRLSLGGLLIATSTLVAGASPIQVTLLNAGNPPLIAPSVTIDGVTKTNVYVGPYTLLINGQDVAAMCLDFDISSTLGSTYSANVTPVGSSNLSETYSPTEGQEYEEEAYLFTQITQSGADRTGIQEAAWDITAYGIASSSYKSVIGDNGYIDEALANYSSMGASFDIVSDTTVGGEQEFIINASAVTPEPSSLLLLGTGLLGLAAVAKRRFA